MARSALIALLLAATPACLGADQFEDPPCAEDAPATDSYDIQMKASAADVHVGEVVGFTFTVQRDGAPITGLAATASYEHVASGATGVIKLTAGAAGEYAGSRAFFTAGAYTLSFGFKEGSSTITRTFPITVQSH